MSSHLARKVVRQFRQTGPESSEADKLALRERQVLDLLACGYVYKESADPMGIGIETVKTCVKSICRKLHVRNRLEAVAKFAQR
jgi:DNA-binding NarL/FixJ family response regulator